MRDSYDVVVIGAGIVGLACAWTAARRGLSVLVLERGRAGGAASGVAAGMLAPVTEVDFGEERLLELNRAGALAWPAFAAELARASALDVGYRACGALVVAADRDDAAELRRVNELQRGLGLAAEWLTPSAARELEPGLSPRIAGAVRAEDEGEVDPRLALQALQAALTAAGGELRENTAAVEVLSARGIVAGVRTSEGAIATRRAVVAAGAWSPELGRVAVRPLKGQILRLRGRRGAPAPARRVIRTPRCYAVPRAGGEVVVGATMEERGFDVRVTADAVFGLLEAAREVLPDVGELEFAEASAGLRPATPDNLPIVGAGETEGLVWATGHGRGGVLLAPITATAVADILEGGEAPKRFRGLSPERFAASSGHAAEVAR